MLTFVGRKWAESFLPCGASPRAKWGYPTVGGVTPSPTLGPAAEHVRISVETRGSPVDLVYAALDVGGEVPRRFSSAPNNCGKSL